MNDIWLELGTGEIEDRFDGEQVFHPDAMDISRLTFTQERTHIDELMREELHDLLDQSINAINRVKYLTIN